MKDAFGALQTLLFAAESLKDPPVVILTHVLRLRMLVDAAMWDNVQDSLSLAESALGLVYQDAPPSANSKGMKEKEKEDFILFENAFEASMAVHTLILGVVYHTHVGQASKASPRLSHLHGLLDSDVLKLFSNGTLKVRFLFSQVLESFLVVLL